MKMCPPDEDGNTDVYTFEENGDQTHYNFLQAANELENDIREYLNEFKICNSDTQIILTGHSRGGAVSNLIAKNLSDDLDFEPMVTAYTFATPNVAPYTNTTELYPNIFNFCKNKDFIPCIPLTDNNWNYWKYGKTYIEDEDDNEVYCNKITAIMSSEDYAPNVQEYYNRKFSADDNENIKISLYDYMQMSLATQMNGNSNYYIKMKNSKNIMSFIGNSFKGMSCLTEQMKKDLGFILINHWQKSYKALDFSNYKEYTFSDALERCNAARNDSSVEASAATLLSQNEDYTENEIVYNSSQVSAIQAFLQCADGNGVSNADKLGWDVSDCTTWSGVSFNANGEVVSVKVSFKDLYGSIDFSSFLSLVYVDISANYISSINVSNCANLTYLDVSDNEITSIDINSNVLLEYLDCSSNDIENLNVSSNINIETLNCYSCLLNSLDVSNLFNLQEMDCSCNTIQSIDLSNNTNLIKLYCFLNYFDIEEGSTQCLQFVEVENRNNSEVIYYPQYAPANANYNSYEMNALREFALSGENNSVLNWLDENNDIDLSQVDENVWFEKFDGIYRIAYIDIANLSITGTLNLSAFSCLKELDCSNTEISALILPSISDLEYLDCNSSELTQLTLPTTCDKLNYVDCKNNHLDISIFTDDFINDVLSFDGGTIKYKHQIINASADEFDENDYNALCAFANQKDNLSSLDWDLTAPGEWDYVNWKLDTVSGKYKLLDCYFDCLDITGDIDLSGCTALEYASFSGSDIETAKLPVLTEKLYTASTVETASLGANENAFYDCPKLEAVVISPLAEKIESGAFYNCKALQAVYVPESVISIADNSFGNCPNLTLAGADETTVSEYAFENSISFEEGYFLCARVNCQENTSGTFSAYYPIEDAQIINGDTVSAQTDEYGFFTVFGLEDGQYSYTVSYKYGFNVPLIASISGGCKTVTPPIAMPAFNFNRDGYITMRDYTMLVRITQDSEDFKYYDINRDSVIDDVEKNLFTGLWNMAASDVISYNV